MDIHDLDDRYLNHVYVERVCRGAVSESAWLMWSEPDLFDTTGGSSYPFLCGDEPVLIARAIVHRVAHGRQIGPLVLHEALLSAWRATGEWPSIQRREEKVSFGYDLVSLAHVGPVEVLAEWLTQAIGDAEWGIQPDGAFITKNRFCDGYDHGLNAPARQGELACVRVATRTRRGSPYRLVGLYTREEARHLREQLRSQRREAEALYDSLRREAGDHLRGLGLDWEPGQEGGTVTLPDGRLVSARGALHAAGVGRENAEHILDEAHISAPEGGRLTARGIDREPFRESDQIDAPAWEWDLCPAMPDRIRYWGRDTNRFLRDVGWAKRRRADRQHHARRQRNAARIGIKKMMV